MGGPERLMYNRASPLNIEDRMVIRFRYIDLASNHVRATNFVFELRQLPFRVNIVKSGQGPRISINLRRKPQFVYDSIFIVLKQINVQTLLFLHNNFARIMMYVIQCKNRPAGAASCGVFPSRKYVRRMLLHKKPVGCDSLMA